jgi:hypothetical protein
MRQKPFILIVLAALHFLAPIGNLLINSYRQHVQPSYLWNFWLYEKASYHMMIYVVIPMFSGLFIYICRRWSLYAYLFCIAVTVVTSALGFHQYTSVFSIIAFFVAIALDIVLVVYFMLPQVKRVYLDPRLRWWETAPRYNYQTSANILNIGKGRVSNISIGGLLLFTDSDIKDNQLIKMEFESDPKIEVSGQVVYHRQMKEKGYGIQFDKKSSKEKALKGLIRKLENDGKRLQDRSGEKYNIKSWATDLVKSGKGIIPEIEKR